MTAEVPLTFGRADDFVVVSKPRKGIAFVEARFKSGFTHTHKGCQQIIALLERELSSDKLKDDILITLDTDLLDDPILYRDVPVDMFQSLRVVEFQGLDPSVRNVSARDVAIKISFDGFNPDFGSDLSATSDPDMVTVLPSTKPDGIWEFC